MFPARYYPAAMFAARYFPKVGAESVEPEVARPPIAVTGRRTTGAAALTGKRSTGSLGVTGVRSSGDIEVEGEV
jgi:hypothetical protein